MKLSTLLSWGENVPILLTRTFLGFGFYLTGSGKLKHLDNLINYFASLGVPLANLQAPFVARLEYYGAICLLLGLATRPVAALLASTMVVALWLADREKFVSSWSLTSDVSPADVTSFVYLVCLLWLMLRGGGHLSLDFGLWRVVRGRLPQKLENLITK